MYGLTRIILNTNYAHEKHTHIVTAECCIYHRGNLGYLVKRVEIFNDNEIVLDFFYVYSMFNSVPTDGCRARLHNMAFTRRGHDASSAKARSEDIAYSPDGSLLAVASSIGIWLYDAESGKELSLLRGHTGEVYSVSFSPDGNTIASGGDATDSTIRLWDVATGHPLKALTGHVNSSVESVSFSPDGQTLASASHDIHLWDVATGRKLKTLTVPTGHAESVSFSPDGQTLASASSEPNSRSWEWVVRLWDVATGQNLKTLTGHTSIVTSVSLAPMDGHSQAEVGTIPFVCGTLSRGST